MRRQPGGARRVHDVALARSNVGFIPRCCRRGQFRSSGIFGQLCVHCTWAASALLPHTSVPSTCNTCLSKALRHHRLIRDVLADSRSLHARSFPASFTPRLVSSPVGPVAHSTAAEQRQRQTWLSLRQVRPASLPTGSTLRRTTLLTPKKDLTSF